MIGNKTCVLSKCGALDKNLGINLQHFTVDMWNMMDASEQPEPEFKARMNEGMEMCYKFSQSIPQDILAAKGPMYEMFGRQMKFFMCKKVRIKVALPNFGIFWQLLSSQSLLAACRPMRDICH